MQQSQTNGSKNRITVYQRVTEQVMDLLKQGTVPWQKSWDAHVGPPRNGVSGRYYRGFNVFVLSLAGFESPYWFTPRQVNGLDAHIRKGERVRWVQFWKFWDPGKGSETREDEPEKRRKGALIIRAYRVVNLDQCEGPGIKIFRDKHAAETPVRHDNDPIAACERIVDGMPNRPGVRFGGDRACYHMKSDVVELPHLHAFVSSEEFYAAYFHELVHSTGHPERLNRKTLTDGTPFGSPTYSREELVAEMGAAFLCAVAGIEDPTLQNSAAYIDGWLTYLRSDPKALIVAGAQAQKAADYVMGWAGVEEVEAAEELAEASA